MSRQFRSILAGLLVGALGITLERSAAQDVEPGFPQAAVDYFRDMDGAIPLNEAQIKGRNTWMLWTAGNDAFWDYLASNSFGTIDILKILDSRKRGQRFAYYGVINEAGFKQATGPDEFGLFLDAPDGTEDPFYATDYRESFPKEDFLRVYGRSTGILGLRLFPNPNFDAAARENWDADRYFNDPAYYRDPDLVRPYRVGIACGFCHAGPDPVRPPADPEHPEFGNLSTYVGGQYWWPSRIISFEQDPSSFVWQILYSMPPGTIDTSFVSTDNINNTRTINAIYNVLPRLGVARTETLAGGNLHVRGTQPQMDVPHILKDGSDSVGIVGALSRVFVNIGEFHEEWVKHFNIFVGGRPQTPFPVELAERNSPHWRATADRVDDLAAFFIAAANPHYLADAPDGAAFLSEPVDVVERGKQVFAANCARCHSSKQPEPPAGIVRDSAEWDAWVRTDDFKRKMALVVMQPDFLDGNFLSTERRYPVTRIGTNACAALASNGIRGNIWDNFTSETYKQLPAAGAIKVQNPITGAESDFVLPAGGRGYYRVPSLISLWATAPYFHHNALGQYIHDPSVAARMTSFQDGIEKLLWPEKRAGFGSIRRTTEESWLIVDKTFLPRSVVKLLEWKNVLEPGDRELRLGPIPKGTPVNLLANLNNELSLAGGLEHIADLVEVVFEAKMALRDIRERRLDDEATRERLRQLVPSLLKLSTCPDFVEDRGHLFGTSLPDDDKRALIAFLKRV